MAVNPARLLEEALQLPERERSDLAARLIDSLDPNVDPDAERAWETEIAHRIAQLDQGQVTLVPWPQARRMILGQSDGPSAG